MKDKIEKISKINSDLDYLRGEYKDHALWGSAPDGDVRFDSLIEWMGKNSELVKFMVEVSHRLEVL